MMVLSFSITTGVAATIKLQTLLNNSKDPRELR
jgi:hypothetical protein